MGRIVRLLMDKMLVKCVLAYVFIVLLPSTMLCIYVHDSIYAGMRSNFVSQQDLLSYDIAKGIESHFVQIESAAKSFQYSDALIRFIETSHKSEAYEMYDYKSSVLPFFGGVLLRTNYIEKISLYCDSEELIRILPEFHGYDDPYFDGVIKTRLKTDKSFWTLDTGGAEPILKYHFCLYNNSITRPVAVVQLTCSFSMLTSLIDHDKIELYALLDKDVPVLLSDQIDETLTARIRVYCNTLPESPNAAHTVFLDDSHYASATWIRRLDLQLVIVSSWISAISSSVDAYKLYLILALCVATNLAFFIMIFKPIQNIKKLSAHMQKGALTEYDHNNSRDEIADLIRSYNHLVRTTKEMGAFVRRSETLRMDAQLSSLKAQINPHFFYGTLECIRMMAEANEQHAIAETAYAFSNLMRHSLSQERYSTIANELEITKQYAGVQSIRYGERVTVVWDVDEMCNDVVCPHFILQPLVENIFVHGVARTRQTVNVRIIVHRIDDGVKLAVVDDGPGIDESVILGIREILNHPLEASAIQSDGNGRALLNIGRRLCLYYADQYQFSITSTPYEATCISMWIPSESPSQFSDLKQEG